MEVPELEDAGYPGQEHDQLFKSDYQHSAGENCSSCDVNQTENRGVRKSTRSVVHHGLIASRNLPMRSSAHRDHLRDSWGVVCFECETAGLMDTFPCIFIRGICNYSDSHRYEIWQPYAAIAAAAYTKDLLRSIHPQEVETIPLPGKLLCNNELISGNARMLTTITQKLPNLQQRAKLTMLLRLWVTELVSDHPWEPTDRKSRRRINKQMSNYYVLRAFEREIVSWQNTGSASYFAGCVYSSSASFPEWWLLHCI